MDAKTFFNHVVEMRKLQKEYFQTRSSITLYKAKKIEKIIDDEVDRVMQILSNINDK